MVIIASEEPQLRTFVRCHFIKLISVKLTILEQIIKDLKVSLKTLFSLAYYFNSIAVFFVFKLLAIDILLDAS